MDVALSGISKQMIIEDIGEYIIILKIIKYINKTVNILFFK